MRIAILLRRGYDIPSGHARVGWPPSRAPTAGCDWSRFAQSPLGHSPLRSRGASRLIETRSQAVYLRQVASPLNCALRGHVEIARAVPDNDGERQWQGLMVETLMVH